MGDSSSRVRVEDLTAPEVIADPYPAYAALRDSSPHLGLVDYPPGTIPGQDPPVTAWALLRYADVDQAVRDHATFSSKDPRQEASEAPTLMLVNHDEPEHGPLRRLFSAAFTKRRVELLRPWLTEHLGPIVDQLGEAEEIELIEAVAARVPALVMTRLLGFPPEDAALLERWAPAFMLSADLTPEERNASNAEMAEYVVGHVGRCATGAGPDWDNLTTAMLAAEVEGRRLAPEEVVLFCITLLVAGAETTTGLIGNVVYEVATREPLRRALVADRSLIEPTIEETLRLTGPPQRLFRVATRDVELGGLTIGAGDWVALFFAAANRDPEVFDEPDTFRLGRPNVGQHLTFGRGNHFCLGAQLARLETAATLDALLDRAPDLRLGSTPPRKQSVNLLNHSFASLPVHLGGQRSATSPNRDPAIGGTAMPDTPNIALTREMYRAVPAGDAETVFAGMHSEVEITYYGNDVIPYAGTYNGPEGVAAFLGAVAESVEVIAMEPELFIEDGEHLAVFGHLKFRTTGGTDFESDFAHIVEIRDGKWYRFRDFANSALVADVFNAEAPVG
ncbi:MAG: cytochrome P450 [Actinomycetota bacterium]